MRSITDPQVFLSHIPAGLVLRSAIMITHSLVYVEHLNTDALIGCIRSLPSLTGLVLSL